MRFARPAGYPGMKHPILATPYAHTMRRWFELAVLVAALAIAACSGDSGTAPKDDGNGGGGGGGGGAPTHLDSLRVQTVDALALQLDAWDGLDPDSIATRALAYLKSQPTIHKAGITSSTTTVWATFTDGVRLVIPNNREPSSQADTLVDAASAPAPALRAAAPHRTIPAGRKMMSALTVPTSKLELPAVQQFRAFNAIGTCHVNPLPVIRSLLKDGNYVEASHGPGQINDFKISGDGVFYLNTHGGAGYDDQLTLYYALWTLTPFDIPSVATYGTMVHNGEVAVMVEKSNDALGNCRNVAHYGITGLFVSSHMHFAKNSVVFLDACGSAAAYAIDMRQGFANAGASVIVGWSRPVNDVFAYAAMKYLIDRLLGVNEISPESPRQRAFNIDQVRKDMEDNRHLVDDPYPIKGKYLHAILTVFKPAGDFGLLSPSIQFLSIELPDESQELWIAGLFGTDPGPGNRAVKINGTSVHVIDWQKTLIKCDLDDTGANAAGTVVVEVGSGADPRRSNEVNLTLWKGTLVYERNDPGTLKVEIRLNVAFRADIHSFRDEPAEQPFETTVLFMGMKDSSVDVTTSGTYAQTQDLCTDTFNFSHTLHMLSPFEPSPDGGWTYFGSVDSQSHVVQLNMHEQTLFQVGTWVRSGDPDCGLYTVPLYGTLQIDNCLFDDLVGVTTFRLQMDPDYSVQADDRPPCTVPALLTYLTPLTGQASIHWAAMRGEHLPDPDAAR